MFIRRVYAAIQTNQGLKNAISKRLQLGKFLVVISIYATNWYGHSNYYYFIRQKWSLCIKSLYVFFGFEIKLTLLKQNTAKIGIF